MAEKKINEQMRLVNRELTRLSSMVVDKTEGTDWNYFKGHFAIVFAVMDRLSENIKNLDER